jgi:ribosomal 50S subunit-recycling heat shock protein
MRTILFAVVPLVVLAVASTAMFSGCTQSSGGTVITAGKERLTVAEGIAKVSMTYAVSPGAEVTLNGKSAKPEDLKPGDSVTLTTRPEGDKTVAVAIEAKRPADEPKGRKDDPAASSPEKSEDQRPQKSAPPIEVMPFPLGKTMTPLSAPPELRGPERRGQVEPEKKATASMRRDKLPWSAQATPAQSLHAGEIIYIDGRVLHVVVEQAQAHVIEEMIFALTDQTQVLIDGAPARIVDLMRGMPVTVVAERVGAGMIAKRIEVKPMSV